MPPISEAPSWPLLSGEGKFLARKTEAVDLSSSRAPADQICRLAQ
jgi:hypothetical protein